MKEVFHIAASVAVVAAKAAVALLTDEKARTAVLSVIIGIVAAIALGIMLIIAMLTATANQNEAYLTALFSEDGRAPPGISPEETIAFDKLKLAFSLLDKEISAQNEGLNEDQRIDAIRVKSIFLSLWPGGDYPDLADDFLSAFVSAFTLEDPYPQLESVIGRPITEAERDYADGVYRYIAYGEVTQLIDIGLGGTGWNDNLPAIPGGFAPPIGGDWRPHITSGFGQRTDPVTKKPKVTHTGLDIALPTGTPIYAAKSGQVLFVKYQTTSYGYHFAIDHGGGVTTMYCHTSKIFVTEGQWVEQGQEVALIGSTGKSTGPHLHFEIRVDGKPVDPLPYLP